MAKVIISSPFLPPHLTSVNMKPPHLKFEGKGVLPIYLQWRMDFL